MESLFNTSLENKTALVCGSTQGIGKASAILLASLGARVILLSRNENALVLALKDLPNPNQVKHGYIVADHSNIEGLAIGVSSFIAENPIHILVNNTGGPPSGPIVNADLSAFLSAFNNHLLANHTLMQTVIPSMKESGYGRIINIISTSVKLPLKNLGVSNTIRAAVANWSKTLASELAPFGITVNNVLPGATLTGRLTAIIDNNAAKKGVEIAEVKEEMLHEIPMGRFADPLEVAAAVAFFASPAAAYITGTNLPVDGGRTGCL